MTQGYTLSYSPYTLPSAMPASSLPPETLITSNNEVSRQTAPIFKLPSDILYHVLWDLSDGWVTLNSTTDIWVFTRVSRSLRFVSLTFANLWARISLEPEDIQKCRHHAVDILRTILDRTTSNPLSHSANLRLRVHVDMSLVHANLLDILTAHYRRWYSLDLNISLFLLNTLSAQMAPLGFPLLSHLRLSLGSDQTNIPDLDVFSLCPALKSVEFDSVPRCKALRLPWPHLTRLVLKERVRSDFLRMLLSAPALQYAELVSVLPSLHPEDPNDDPLPKSRIIEHKSLKSLVLKCIPFAVVLDSLYLPNLAELTLEHTAQASFGNLLGFIKRSNDSGKLKSLILSGSLFLEEPKDALTRSMSSSSLPSSIPPSPVNESGPSSSPFVPSSDNMNLTSSPTSSMPPDIPAPDASLHEVLEAASSLTTLVIEDWTPLRSSSPYDAFFISLTPSGESLLKRGVSLPATPMGVMAPASGLSSAFSSVNGTPGIFSPGLPGINQSLDSLPPASAIPAHLQRSPSSSHLTGLPPHLVNNPHLVAATAHLAAMGLQLPPDTFANPGPFSPGFGSNSSPVTSSNNNFAEALKQSSYSGNENSGGRTPAAVQAAHGALGIPVEQDVLLPNLKNLIISNLSRNVVDLHLLAGMVESRWRERLTDHDDAHLPNSSSPSPPTDIPKPSIISSVSLHTDLRLIKNKGSVGRIKALQKDAEVAAKEGKGKKVKVYVSAKRWNGI